MRQRSVSLTVLVLKKTGPWGSIPESISNIRIILAKIPRLYFQSVDMKVGLVHVARRYPKMFRFATVPATTTVPGFIPAPGHQMERFIQARHLLEVSGQIGDVFDNQMNDIAGALHPASAAHHGGRENGAAVPFENRGPDDNVHVRALIFEGDEHHALG